MSPWALEIPDLPAPITAVDGPSAAGKGRHLRRPGRGPGQRHRGPLDRPFPAPSSPRSGLPLPSRGPRRRTHRSLYRRWSSRQKTPAEGRGGRNPRPNGRPGPLRPRPLPLGPAAGAAAAATGGPGGQGFAPAAAANAQVVGGLDVSYPWPDEGVAAYAAGRSRRRRVALVANLRRPSDSPTSPPI